MWLEDCRGSRLIVLGDCKGGLGDVPQHVVQRRHFVERQASSPGEQLLGRVYLAELRCLARQFQNRLASKDTLTCGFVILSELRQPAAHTIDIAIEPVRSQPGQLELEIAPAGWRTDVVQGLSGVDQIAIAAVGDASQPLCLRPPHHQRAIVERGDVDAPRRSHLPNGRSRPGRWHSAPGAFAEPCAASSCNRS